MESRAASAPPAAASPSESTLGTPSWRGHWAIKLAIPAIYLGASVAAVFKWGLPYSQDWIFVWIVGLMLIFSIGDHQRSAIRLIRDWLPMTLALLAYDLLRGFADGKLLPPSYQPPIEVDKVIGLGQIPTIRLQEWLFDPAHIHWYDYVAFSFWFSHFLVTLLAAVGLWLFAYRYFHRFAACVVTLAALGLATYVLFPAAPPWLAAHEGFVPHLSRIIPATLHHLPFGKGPAIFEGGTAYANDVAAVPSLHAAYAMLVALFFWPIASRGWRIVLVGYAIGMGISLVYLGEHYVADILLGYVYAAVTILIVNRGYRWLEERRGIRETRQQPA
jgi:membrane-associated phospholipid phosphatase